MDNKNVFVAIALSMSVLLFWGAFFETPKKDNQNLKSNNQIQQKTEDSITPNTNQAPSINQINVEKKIELDEKYLFKISQEIQNNSSKNLELYSYAQITRNKIPDDIQNFYISHEGFIGVFNDELKEDDYDDIEDNKIVRESNKGWLGITDKYWMTVLVPEKGKNFKSTFQYNNTFKANYIINDPIKIK